MSYISTGQAVMKVIQQSVYNLDAQVDQLVGAIERDQPRRNAGIYPGTTGRDNPEHERIHAALVPFFAEVAKAREHLVTAHNQLRDVVAPIDMTRESQR